MALLKTLAFVVREREGEKNEKLKITMGYCFNLMWQGISCFGVISVFYRVTYYVDGAQAIFDPDRSHYNSIIWVTAKLQKSNYIHMNWLQFIHEKYHDLVQIYI